MSGRLLFATTNRGKLEELRGLLGTGIEVLSLADFPGVPAPVEDGETFEANAVKKAREYVTATGIAALADDSGLAVDALGGRPGVHSARYAEGDDRARVEKLLRELQGVPSERRGAAFHCALCLALPSGHQEVTVGTCPGQVAFAPRGEHGFGYDPVFLLPELGKTMAELTREEKATLSHRGRAFALMRPKLLALL